MTVIRMVLLMFCIIYYNVQSYIFIFIHISICKVNVLCIVLLLSWSIKYSNLYIIKLYWININSLEDIAYYVCLNHLREKHPINLRP